MGLWIAQVFQVFLVLVPIVAIGRPDAAADSSHNNHHRNSHDDGTVDIALDKRGASHMRREDLGSDQTAMHAARRQHPKHQHHRHHKDMFDSSLIVDTKVTADHEVHHAKAQSAEEDAIRIEPPDGAQTATATDAAGGEDLETDEAKLKKMDEVIVSSEEKAGLPDSTKTTPEPEQEGPTREDEEANMIMIIIISIVVIVGSCGAAFSIKRSRANAGKKAEAAEGAEGEEGGEGEAAEGDAAEGDAPAAEAADAPLEAS